MAPLSKYCVDRSKSKARDFELEIGLGATKIAVFRQGIRLGLLQKSFEKYQAPISEWTKSS
jgi:hypothetical protein